MIGYILFLVLSLVLTCICNTIYGYYSGTYDFWYCLLVTFVNFSFIFALDAIIATIIHRLPIKYFEPDLKIYRVSKKERKFLEKIGIRKWKDLVPDMGCLCDFKKGKVESDDLEYLHKFLVEINYAEVIHIGMILVGVFDIIMWPIGNFYNFKIWFIMINTLLNLPPILIQRYNRPRLYDLYKYKQRTKKL